jgi:hypothetical protein
VAGGCAQDIGSRFTLNSCACGTHRPDTGIAASFCRLPVDYVGEMWVSMPEMHGAAGHIALEWNLVSGRRFTVHGSQ